MNISVSRQGILAEGVIIVASILVAFAIDAWWDGRQEVRQQAKLIVALKLDFETTKARLETSIEYAESLIARTDSFLQAAGSDEVVPIDSLRHSGGGAFHKMDLNRRCQPTKARSLPASLG